MLLTGSSSYQLEPSIYPAVLHASERHHIPGQTQHSSPDEDRRLSPALDRVYVRGGGVGHFLSPNLRVLSPGD
ncbi:hypothetical protein R3I94_013790 [Phoxinus phoxinus]